MLFSSQVSDIQNILQSKKGTTIGGFYLSRACHVLLSKTLTQFSEPPPEGAVVYSNMTAFLKTTSSDHLGVSLDGGIPPNGWFTGPCHSSRWWLGVTPMTQETSIWLWKYAAIPTVSPSVAQVNLDTDRTHCFVLQYQERRLEGEVARFSQSESNPTGLDFGCFSSDLLRL